MRKYAALLVVTGLSLLPALPAAAATRSGHSRSTITPSPTAAAAAWLATQVQPGGFLASATTPTTPNLGLTAQGVLALAEAGVAKTQVDAMETYLAAHVDDYVVAGGADQPAPLAFLILDAVATGRDATTFGGTDLVSRLQATQQGGGLFGSQDPTYDGTFRQGLSLLALDAVGIDSASGAAWLTGQQCADGGWTAFRADTTVPCPAVDPDTFAGPDTNSTAVAAEALHALGATPSADPVAWLHSVRTSSGGFAYLGLSTLSADANSTGLVTQALQALTGSPDTAGLVALATFQAGCSADPLDRGGVAFQPDGSGDLFPDILATVQAIWGLSGQTLPVLDASISSSVPAVCAVVATTTTSTTVAAATTTSTTTAAAVTEGTTPTAGTAAELPRTGSDSDIEVLLGVVLLALGSGLVLAARRVRLDRV